MRQRHADDSVSEYPKGTHIKTIFESDSVERRLVLLGRPGAGKTTQLLHLAEAMLDRIHADSTAPTPIYLPLSIGEWEDIVLESLKAASRSLPRAVKWFAEQIASNYQVPKRKVLDWLSANPCPIVLLLDGLDEIASIEERKRCVRALSQARRLTHAGMVVACRTDDYTAIGEILNFGSAIDIMPINGTDIDEYLGAAGADLESLRYATASDDVLKKLLDTPLMLNVAAMAYKDREVESDLLIGSLARRRDQLWQTYVTEMLKRRRNPQQESTGNPTFTAERTEHYLKFLAETMARNSYQEFNPRYLNWRWLPDSWRMTILSLTAMRALLVCGLLDLAIWSFCTSAGGSILSGVVGIVFGTVSAIVGAALLIGNASESAVSWKWSWPYALKIVVSSFFCGVGVAICLMLGGPPIVVFGCLWGLYAGLILASVAGWRPIVERTKVRIELSPWLLCLARVTTLSLCLLSAIWMLPLAREHHIGFRSTPVAVAGMSCVGFAVAAAFFSVEIWLDHCLSRLVVAYLKLLPIRIKGFLAHADERILLRRVGVHYRFLHLTLRDHLSGIHAAAESQTVILKVLEQPQSPWPRQPPAPWSPQPASSWPPQPASSWPPQPPLTSRGSGRGGEEGSSPGD
jgi:hypothetical protein